MCIFFNFDHLRIKLQSSDFFRGTKFRDLHFLSLHSSSLIVKLLSIASYGGELLLDSSSP